MPHNINLITTIAVALGLALIFGFGAVRLKLPALVGYLVEDSTLQIVAVGHERRNVTKKSVL